MTQDNCSHRLFPGLDDDEVESPPFPFARFEKLMAATYLSHIRHPHETRYQIVDWLTQLTPHWRWAQAHHLLEAGRASSCDEDTFFAYHLLRTRARGSMPNPGIQPIVDAILIYERNDRTRWLLESHLLLPEPPANLAAKLGLAPVTIRYFKSWFFDVGRRLTKSSWINGRVLGGSPLFGFADDDLAPIWRRVAYYSQTERMLDMVVAVTTGVGREQLSAAECDSVQLWVEEMRLSPINQAEQVIQLHRRRKAERLGEHPSSYYTPRRRRMRHAESTTLPGHPPT